MKLWSISVTAGTKDGCPVATVVMKACRSHVLMAPWSPFSSHVWNKMLWLATLPPPKPSLKLKPALGTSKQMLFRRVVFADLAWKKHADCLAWIPSWWIKLEATRVFCGKFPPVPSGPVPGGCSGWVPVVLPQSAIAVAPVCASMVWHGMVDVCDGYLAAEASGSSFG